MKYATWRLNFDNPKYGTGADQEIVKQGYTAEGAYLLGDAKDGTIVGYFTGEPANLDPWDFAEVTKEEALALVKAVNDTATVLEDGKIAIALEDDLV